MEREHNQRLKQTLAILIPLALLFTACTSTTAPQETTTPTTTEPTATAIPATETAVPPTPTDEPLTPTVILPTETAVPTETATAVPEPEATPEEEEPDETAVLPTAPPSVATHVETLVVELPSATGGLTIDADDNIYVGDMGLAPARLGETVWQVRPTGEFAPYAEKQGLLGASGNIMLPDGTLYQSSFTGGTVSKITPDGTVTQIADEGLSGPVGLTVDEAGNIYVADCRGSNIDKIEPDGTVSSFASSSLFRCPNGITRDPAGNFYVLNFSNGKLLRVSPDGQTVEEFVTFLNNNNGGHVIYGNGQLYAVARGANQIYTVSLAGEATLLAGSGERGLADGPALESSFNLANDIVLSSDGKRLYVNQAADLSGNNKPSSIRVIYLE